MIEIKPVTLQCDASLKGLGACIIQDSKPIAFASKNLTDTETRYTNIERELLAFIFSCEKFHTYLYGRSFMVETDHKPLEMISLEKLDLSSCPFAEECCYVYSNTTWSLHIGQVRRCCLADVLSHLPS